MDSKRQRSVLVSIGLITGFCICLVFALKGLQDSSTSFHQTTSLNAAPISFLDTYQIANDAVTEWNPESHLLDASWIVHCSDDPEPPRRILFTFISKRRRLLAVRTWYAQVWVDSESRSVEVSAADMTEARPPVWQTMPEELDFGIAEAFRIANSAGGDEYKAHHPNCVVRIWLEDNTWRLDFDPSLDEYREELTILVNGRSGDVNVTRKD